MLVVWEMPLATAPITLYLGLVLFDQRAEGRRLLRSFVRALPQMIWYQVVLRALWIPLVATWFYLFAARPFLGEVILLERTPLGARRDAPLSTGVRSRVLHAMAWGELFLQWMAALAVGSLLVASVFGSAWLLSGQLLGQWEWRQTMLTVWLPSAMWLVIGYFAVVRFLAYLDLRIRREGWEVELLMRAEAVRLGTGKGL